MIRDIWFQCSGREAPNAHGIKLRYTNTGLVENSFFTGCNHGIHTQGAWQVRLVLNHWGGAGPQQNSICLFMDEPAADDPEHNNAVIATNNICENPALYGLRWLSAQGSVFTGNQWMKGIIGIYGCDPERATFADGKPFDCQFVFFSGDQADSTTAQGWLFKRGLASVLGAGISMVNVWSGNTFMAGIEIDGADGLQIVGADVQSSDTGVSLKNSTNIRLDGQIRSYNRRNFGSAAVALDGTTNSSVSVTTKATHAVGYNGIVEKNAYGGNSIYGDWANCALGLTFGGNSSGIGSESTSCKYQISGMTVRIQTYLKLSAKGTATGPGAITGLPVLAALGRTGSAGASVLYGTEGMVNLSGSIFALVQPGTNIANLHLQKESGGVPITDFNFTNKSIIQGQIEYFKK